MKVCGFVASLGAGGAERVMASIANCWADAGHEVSIVTLASPGDDAYRVDPRVKLIALSMMKESRSLADGVVLNLRRIGAFRRAIQAIRPDVIVSFHAQLNVVALLGCVGLRVPVIASERVHPPSDDIGLKWEYLRRLTYRLAATVVVQSEVARQWATGVAPANRIRIIPNAVSAPFTIPADGAGHNRLPVVLGVGRLVPQKGFDILIRAFASVSPAHSDWSLTIIGEGPEEESLKALAAELTAPGAVTFAGRVHNPEEYYRTAGVFVLPSRFEGFPNALLEAMACGCAVIAADCAAGPSEIVHMGMDGVLVPPDDVVRLAQEMGQLMANGEARRRLGARARDVAHRFHPDRVMALWGEAIARVRD